MLSTSYDATADALYVRLNHNAVARTEELDAWTLVDVDASGAAVGVEVLHPARQWPANLFCERYHMTDDERALFAAMFTGAAHSPVRFPAPDQAVDATGTRMLEAV